MSRAWPSGLRDEAVTWHDVECAGYGADLPVWRELADGSDGPVLDLGCGTGRVALDLAALGATVTGVDSDPSLVRALAERARERRLAVRAEVADVRSLALPGPPFGLAIAPMQVVQLLGGAERRAAALARARDHLRPGGLLCAALADPFEGVPSGETRPPLPDMLERDGWVLSSTPVAVRDESDGTAIDRARQAVSPAGELTESLYTVRLDRVEPAELEESAAGLGFRPRPALAVPATEGYVGSVVVVLEAA